MSTQQLSAASFKGAQAGSDVDYLELRDHIVDTASSWQSGEKKPPASVKQLVTMALFINQAPMTPKEVSNWICEHFPYYKCMAYESLWSRGSGSRGFSSHNPSQFEDQLAEVFRLYELPLRSVNAGTEARYSIGTFDAKRALLDVLRDGKDVDHTTFDFFRLPPELRNQIYGYAFVFPKSGLLLPSTASQRGYVVSRDLDNADEFRDRTGRKYNSGVPYDKLLRTPTVKSMLSSMCANKQFREEALPVFYGSNKLYFACHSDLHDTITRIPASHRELIRDVSFDYGYSPDGGRVDLRVFENGILPSLAKLEMFYDETWYTKPNIITLPGLSSLRRVTGLEEAKFHGCPTIEGLLKAGMEKAKTEDSSSTGKEKKKRKKGTAHAVTGERGTKKAKKTKSG